MNNNKTFIEFTFAQKSSTCFTYVNFSPHNIGHIASKW